MASELRVAVAVVMAVAVVIAVAVVKAVAVPRSLHQLTLDQSRTPKQGLSREAS